MAPAILITEIREIRSSHLSAPNLPICEMTDN